MNKKHPTKILVKRERAYGDVLCIEPVLRALKRDDPESEIYVQTQCVEILRYAPTDIREIGLHVEAPGGKYREFDRIIDLNLSYEKRPMQHLVTSYAETAAVDLDRHNRDHIPVYDRNLSWTGQGSRIIAVNSDGSAPNRRLDLGRWRNVIRRIQNTGYTIVEVGRENYLNVGEDRVGKLTLRQTAEIISTAELYMGFDGALMHIAQAIGTPVFIIFGCTCPNYRIHDWSRARVVWLDQKQLPCAGCHHWRPSPRLDTACDRDKIYCLENMSEEMILAQFFYGKNGEMTEPLQRNDSQLEIDAQDVLYQCYTHTRPFVLERPITQLIRRKKDGQKVRSLLLFMGTLCRAHMDVSLKIELLNELDELLAREKHVLSGIRDNSYVHIKLIKQISIPSSLIKLRISLTNAWNPFAKERPAVFLDELSDESVEVEGKILQGGIHMVVS